MIIDIAPLTWRIVVVEDDALIAALVSDGLRAQGYSVTSATSPTMALAIVEDVDPHIVVCDLNFPNGESGAELIATVREARPWVAVVVLTAHQSPELAVPDAHALPEDVVYLVKSSVRTVSQLTEGVEAAMTGRGARIVGVLDKDESSQIVSPTHAEVLRLLAEGSSTKSIAARRGTSVRAVESLLVRLYLALNIDVVNETNPRVIAIRKWQSGLVRVARPPQEDGLNNA